MKVALAQFAAGEDKPANLERLRALAGNAAAAGASLVLAPEASMHGFEPSDRPLADVAEPLDGHFVTALGEIARELGLTIAAGMFETADGGRAFNTVVAVGPTGELAGSYRKQHLFDALGWTESARLAPGTAGDQLLLDVGDLRIGVLTCYDLRFPELARALVDDGATALAIPSAWVAGPHKLDQWEALTTARAVENVCYVLACGQPPPEYVGHSRVVDPFGDVLAALADEDGVAVADITADRVTTCRQAMPSLSHRQWSVTPKAVSS